MWDILPDSILLHIFAFLPHKALMRSSQCCKHWCRVANDDLLWRAKVHHLLPPQGDLPRPPNDLRWKDMYQRIYSHVPVAESEFLGASSGHHDEVWHVSYSHDGKMLATASKDGAVKVWRGTYPAKLLHTIQVTEGYAHYSEFNRIGSHLLVSWRQKEGIEGGIIVYRIEKDEPKQVCNVHVVPSTFGGSWLTNDIILYSQIQDIINHFEQLTSIVMCVQVGNDLHDEREHKKLFSFQTENGGFLQRALLSDCSPEHEKSKQTFENNVTGKVNSSPQKNKSESLKSVLNCFNCHRHLVDQEKPLYEFSQSYFYSLQRHWRDKYLICRCASNNHYQSHQVWIKKIVLSHLEPDTAVRDLEQTFDDVDHVFEMNGFISDIVSSDDQRYVYANVRPWPKGFEVTDPYDKPPLQDQYDIHVIDLQTMTDLGPLEMTVKPKASNVDGLIQYIDASQPLIAVPSEEDSILIYDKEWGVTVDEVYTPKLVNAVMFLPHDPGTLIYACDDYSVRILRSRYRQHKLTGRKRPERQLVKRKGEKTVKCFEFERDRTICYQGSTT